MTDDHAEARHPASGRAVAESAARDLAFHHIQGLSDPDRKEASLEFLHRRYARWIRNLLLGRGLDREASDDLTQQTFIRVFRGSGNFETVAEFEAWLKQIAINVHRNHLRDQHAVKRNAPEDPLEDWVETQVPEARSRARPREGGALERFLDKERRHEVGRALQTLPPAMRRCLVLRLFHEMTYQEIAERMGIHVGTVKAHLHQGRARLKERLAPYFGKEDPASPGKAGA